jgi:hypothetical protein
MRPWIAVSGIAVSFRPPLGWWIEEFIGQLGAACGVRHMVGFPLDPNVNTLGAIACDNTVHVRVKREALCVVARSHLLLRVEGNGL